MNITKTPIKRRIFNDPLYGLFSFSFDSVYRVIEHPYFQRLRRIRQLGLSSYVYTGATHSRFNHALGVAHLANQLIISLITKGIPITSEEHEATVLAALLHDIGHGPFSHVLEGRIINKRHEDISLDIMHELNAQLAGKLDVAIQIFTGQYPKQFLSQIIGSQLDVDRLDYLNRDSFYTGVVEGKVGYDRIIKMLTVADNKLLVEQKGIYSVEKFILARRFMYLQVYLHKVVVILDEMLKGFLERYVHVKRQDNDDSNAFLRLVNLDEFESNKYLEDYLKIDDIDIFHIIKSEISSKDCILHYLSSALLDRKLWQIMLSDEELTSDLIENIRLNIAKQWNLAEDETKYIVRNGNYTSKAYQGLNEIEVLTKQGEIKPISNYLKSVELNSVEKMHYLCYPRNID